MKDSFRIPVNVLSNVEFQQLNMEQWRHTNNIQYDAVCVLSLFCGGKDKFSKIVYRMLIQLQDHFCIHLPWLVSPVHRGTNKEIWLCFMLVLWIRLAVKNSVHNVYTEVIALLHPAIYHYVDSYLLRVTDCYIQRKLFRFYIVIVVVVYSGNIGNMPNAPHT